MHMPDGYINAATAVGGAAVAAGGIWASLRQSGRHLREKQIPMAGLTAAFVFAVQMLNFPVAAGTSGHLLGGALAAILLGPWMGALVVTVVVVVQALLFADGGIVALGLNVLNMALVTVLVGWLAFRVLMRVLPKTTGGAIGATMAAGFFGVLGSSTAFVIEYAIGGLGGAPLTTVFATMTGVHALIGIGEGLISGVAVGSVLAVRPDLVTATADLGLRRTATAPGRRTVTAFVAVGLGVALALVFFVAPFASTDPDGLERVAIDQGFSAGAQDHPIEGPLSDYGVSGLESDQVGTMLAGAIGVFVVFGLGLGLVSVIRRRRTA
ncbi:MAG TPA: energy-coupling factor ABC transporter permease [Acidimicrobiia bacterium]|nr:energy-coupling factor ABC transporter permease [Acidimicrobiia bacterium]